jgi:transcriptional regulator with XRE-family HTH domain
VSFAAWVAEVIEERGQSQEAFARDVGVSLSTVSRWTRGLSTPSYGELWSVRRTVGSLPFDDPAEIAEDDALDRETRGDGGKRTTR